MGLKLGLIKFSPFTLIHTGNDDILSAVQCELSLILKIYLLLTTFI